MVYLRGQKPRMWGWGWGCIVVVLLSGDGVKEPFVYVYSLTIVLLSPLTRETGLCWVMANAETCNLFKNSRKVIVECSALSRTSPSPNSRVVANRGSEGHEDTLCYVENDPSLDRITQVYHQISSNYTLVIYLKSKNFLMYTLHLQNI